MDKKEEITNEDVFNLNFYRYKKPFTGSFNGMRYRIVKIGKSDEGEEKLQVFVWPEPFAFDVTPKENIEEVFFDFSEEGKQEAVKWLNKKSKFF